MENHRRSVPLSALMKAYLFQRLTLLLVCAAAPAAGHVSERALVLLLPTEIYIRSGVIAVALTVALLFLIPPGLFKTLFKPVALPKLPMPNLSIATSLAATLLLLAAIYAGFNGSRDPLSNPLPLLIWTIWWITLPILSALLGNIWHFINPWTGLYRISRLRPLFHLPEQVQFWPAVATMLAFSIFTVSDIAPDDPDRLAVITLSYWIFTSVMTVLFGLKWLRTCEPFTVFFSQIARLSPLSQEPALKAGCPGSFLITHPAPMSLAALIIVALAAGSFDGLNETFWWLAQIGINPLEFPGRSAVVLPNAVGLLLSIAALGIITALCTWLGLKMVGAQKEFRALFPRLTLSLLPIALAYHIAHYLTSFMVGVQYSLKAATDPMSNGADILGLGQFYVTTSFFNVATTVEKIWLTQASAIVIGHILAVLIAHAIALGALGDHKRATLSQLPVAAFMIAYTFIGLWILAQPTGV